MKRSDPRAKPRAVTAIALAEVEKRLGLKLTAKERTEAIKKSMGYMCFSIPSVVGSVFEVGKIYDKGDGKIYLEDFDGEIISVPNNAKREKIRQLSKLIPDTAYARRDAKIREKIAGLEKKGYVNFMKWVETTMPRKYALTLGDFAKMRGPTKIVTFDRNFVDVLNDNGKMTAKPPSSLLKNSIATYTPDVASGGIKGRIKWSFGDIHDNFELEVGLKDWWVNQKDGIIPTHNDLAGKISSKPTAVKDLPKTTPMGWRGHMVLLSDIKKLPKMFYAPEM